MDESALGSRIVIVGSSGSGKTTLADQLSEALELPHVELDRLYWLPHWIPCSIEHFRERVATALSGERWIADGNYLKISDLVWGQADTIIWLDYKLPVVMRRLGRRTLKRLIKKQTLFNRNRKVWRTQFLSKDSLIKSYRKRRRQFPQLLSRPEYAHIHVIRLRSPRATKKWLKRLTV